MYRYTSLFSIYDDIYFITDKNEIEYEHEFINRMKPKLKNYICFSFLFPQNLKECIRVINILNEVDDYKLLNLENISAIKRAETKDIKKIIRIRIDRE